MAAVADAACSGTPWLDGRHRVLRSHSRFGRAAPSWVEFYEVSGDVDELPDPGDWKVLGRRAIERVTSYSTSATTPSSASLRCGGSCAARTWKAEPG